MKAHSFYTVSGACREDGSDWLNLELFRTDWANLEPLAPDDPSPQYAEASMLRVGRTALIGRHRRMSPDCARAKWHSWP